MSARLSRRSFLRRSGLGLAAGLAAPTIIPRHVLADAAQPGANDRVQVGYIGVGRRGRELMGLPRDARIVAAADCYLPRAEVFAARFQGAAHLDYREMLDSKDVDAVVIATPDHWHTLPAIHACMAGKDVYCEKPMTLTVREGRQLVDAVRKYERVFQTGSQQRSMAANRLGCELIRNGRLGRITEVLAANYPSPWEGELPSQPVPEGLDWDRWCGQTEPAPFHFDLFTPRANPGWISFRPYSGGEVTGWGSHGLDQIQWALGADESGPVEIWTEGEPFAPPTYTTPESRARGDKLCSVPRVVMRYADGVILRFGGGPGGGGVFIGERGKITIDRNRVTSDPPELAAEPLENPQVRLYESNDHLANWVQCIKTRERCVADVEIGHRSTTVCHLANIARWTERRLQWDPVKEQFIDDDEANRLLSRPQRKGYEIPDV